MLNDEDKRKDSCYCKVNTFYFLQREISFFFYMKTPDDFEPVCDSFTDDESKERLIWVDEKSDITYYPTFFREELRNPSSSVKHIVTDNRK